MLLWLTKYLEHHWHFFHVFQYLTFRSILSTLTALTISLLLGPVMIKRLTYYQVGQNIRNDGPQSHLKKSGTPTMGGALILIAIAISIFLWGNLSNVYVWIVLLVTLGFGAVGWIDDYRKLIRKNTRGLPPKWKFFWQTFIAIAAAIFLYHIAKLPVETRLIVPLLKISFSHWGFFIFPLSILYWWAQVTQLI